MTAEKLAQDTAAFGNTIIPNRDAEDMTTLNRRLLAGQKDNSVTYWQYQGKPVLLLGGSEADGAFQWTGDRLIDPLNLLHSVGGNVIRNVLSDRRPDSTGPFLRREDGRYDLERWKEEYFARRKRFLEETAKREIIVHLTLWDPHDHSHRGVWKDSPWNPANNVTYHVTAMRFKPEASLAALLEAPERYSFAEISQNNQIAMGTSGQAHWDMIVPWRSEVAARVGPRPLNNIKFNGGGFLERLKRNNQYHSGHHRPGWGDDAYSDGNIFVAWELSVYRKAVFRNIRGV